MSSETASRIPPIKLRLSLTSKPGPSMTPAPAPAIASRKGKGKAVEIDHKTPTTTPSIVLRPPSAVSAPVDGSNHAGPSSRPVIKVKPPTAELPSSAISAESPNKTDHIEVVPSTSRLASPKPTTTPPPPALPPVVAHVPEPDPPLPSIPADDIPATPIASTSRSTPKSNGRSGKRAKASKAQAQGRPSAIPPRLLSSDPSTPKPMPPPPLPPSTPATPEVINVKFEFETEEDAEPDPLSLPMSPSGMQISTPKEEGAGQEEVGDEALDTSLHTRTRGGGRWMRLKRPLKELLGRLMVELRRKDEVS